MKIAVPYDNGNIFQHFGRTENFKIYEVADGKVVSSKVIGSEGSGHDALADFLAAIDVELVICGGMGSGAQFALEWADIPVIAGVSGDADAAVEAYLRDELESSGATCDHHGDGGHCGHHEEGGCCGHHGEGGCCGHHGPAPIEGPNVGKTVKAHYTGTFNDGRVFDSSYDRGEPLEFTCGAGMMIRGFDAAVATMEVGEIRDVHLMPEEAYGLEDPNLIYTFAIADLPGSEQLSAGQTVYMQNQMGQQFPVVVLAKTETSITLDANHEMAGKELNFKIELVEVK